MKLKTTFRILVFFFGFSSTINQIIFLREFYVSGGGNELFIAVVFAVWLLGVTCGGIKAGMGRGTKAENVSDEQSASRTLFLINLQAVIAIVTVFLIQGVRVFFRVEAGAPFPLFKLMISSIVFIMPYSFLVGFLFARMCSLAEEISGDGARMDSSRDADSIGFVYTLESLGSAFGGALASLFLIGRFSSVGIVVLCLAALILPQRHLYWRLKKAGRFPHIKSPFIEITGIVSIIIIIMYLTPIGSLFDRISMDLRWRSLGAGFKFIASKDTPYQRLELASDQNQYSLFSNGEYVNSFPDPYDASLRANFYMTLHHDPKAILIIGSGDEELLPFIQKYNPTVVTYIDCDPNLQGFIDEYLSSDVQEAMKKAEIIHTDGRLYIWSLAERRRNGMTGGYDIVLLSLPEPSTIASGRFYTVEFYRNVREILNDDGLLLTSVSSAENYFGNTVLDYSGSVYKSLKMVFPEVLPSPGAKALLVAAKNKGVATLDADVLSRRFASKMKDDEYFTKYHFMTILEPNQTKLTQEAYDNLPAGIPINTDLKPVSIFYNLILWAKMMGSEADRFLIFFKRLGFWGISLPFLIFIILSVLLGLYHAKKSTSLRFVKTGAILILITTGFFMMASEMVAIYMYQKNFGNLYQKIGLLISAFMIGLAAGGYSGTQKKIPDLNSARRVLLRSEIEIITLLIISSVFFRYEEHLRNWVSSLCVESIYFAFLLIVGFLGGRQFPYIGKTLKLLVLPDDSQNKKNSTPLAAGLVEFADHFGAAAGALFTGVIFLPILGVVDTVLLLMLIKIAGFSFLFVSNNKSR